MALWVLYGNIDIHTSISMMANTVWRVGYGQVTNTAWGKVKCCIWHDSTSWVLYFSVHHDRSKRILTDLLLSICMRKLSVSFCLAFCSDSVQHNAFKWWLLLFCFCKKGKFRVLILKLWLKVHIFPVCLKVVNGKTKGCDCHYFYMQLLGLHL